MSKRYRITKAVIDRRKRKRRAQKQYRRQEKVAMRRACDV